MVETGHQHCTVPAVFLCAVDPHLKTGACCLAELAGVATMTAADGWAYGLRCCGWCRSY